MKDFELSADSRVDLVEGDLISGLAVCRERSGAEADNTDVFRASSCETSTTVLSARPTPDFCA